jgi:cytoskeletal protein CcmA (bactofilin family)
MFSRRSERRDRADQGPPAGVGRTPGPAPRPADPRPVVPVPVVGATDGAEVEHARIARGDRMEGTLQTARDVTVLGEFQGTIQAGGKVTIAAGADVEADVTADEVVIGGNYSGHLVCRKRLELQSAGFIKGDIETPSLMLMEGGFIDGALHMKRSVVEGSRSDPGAAGSSVRARTG